MLVIDASALVLLLIGRPGADEVERHMARHAGDVHAPHLLDLEVISALRRLVATGAATAERAEEAAADLLAVPIRRYPHDMMLARVWRMRENFSAYDAVYVALAELLAQGGARLMTADARLARATREHSDASVILVD